MFILNEEYLSMHYDAFMCSYGNVDVSEIISRHNFSPETFFVEQKQNEVELLFFRDVSFHDWIINMIEDIVSHVDNGHDNMEMATEQVYDNVLYLLKYKNSAAQIANQEFVDIIRRVVAYTLTGDVDSKIHTANNFNALASRFLPHVIERFRRLNLSAREMLQYSIASGLSGLDLKGAPAAASSYSKDGIMMGYYHSLDDATAAEHYIESLNNLYNKSRAYLFDWDIFIQLLKENKKLVWMTDDYIESHFDLLVIASLLREYDAHIEIIPKNGYHGNDLAYHDLMELLSGNLFKELKPFLANGRLIVSQYGPKMGAANIRKLSSECVASLKNAGLLFAKGCRIHEMLQGGLSIDLFTSFFVVRTISEITSGLLAEQNQAVFLHLSPREYSFFGVAYENSRPKSINGKNINFCASTIVDHHERKRKENIEELVEELETLRRIDSSYASDKYPLQLEMNMIAQKIEKYTAEQYDMKCRVYSNLNRPDMSKDELWELLFNEVKLCLDKAPDEISLLDVGAGDGRAMEYASSLGIRVFGVDNSKGFIDVLQEKSSKGLIPQNSFLLANMSDLPLEDASFDVVRMNASLLHLPLIGAGFTVDLAIENAKRVLKPGGLLYILVKKGNGQALIDTNEGLGKRYYQMYTHEMLETVLLRNGFIPINKVDKTELRNQDTIEWIAHIAQKPILFND